MRLCTRTIIMHPYGYRKRLCTLHNYYAPVRLSESDEIMHPAQLLCTRMATVWLPESDEIVHPPQLLCTRTAAGK